MLKHSVELIKGAWRYATGLHGFLSAKLDLPEAERLLKRQLENREQTFLRVLERGIYGNPESPYRRILLHEGFQFEDVKRLIGDKGLEGTLSHLLDAGVYVTLDEFKGRAPVSRPGLEFLVTAGDFDNPLLTVHYEGRTGGSRGGGTRVPIDFDLLTHEAANFLCSLYACDVADHHPIIWSAAPPGVLGLKWAFLFGRLGRKMTWFSPDKPRWNRQGMQGRLLISYTVLASRLLRQPIARPEFVPDAATIARHLSRLVEKNTPGLVLGTPSQWVRICLAAEEAGCNIAGTVFWGGGEPFTEGKSAVLMRLGTRAIISYAMAESGTIGQSCGAPTGPDDMHFLTDKLAAITKPVYVESGMEVQALSYTSLLTSAPKVMLNVQSGDYAVIDERDCACLWQQLGFKRHIGSVRSYEKLTSESVMFMGSMLEKLLEETLPVRFGGNPTDYQLVEEEDDGLPRVSIIVAPSIGSVDEEAVVETVLQSVGFADWSSRMAEMWRSAGTLRVRRREPYATSRGKILPLHILGAIPPATIDTTAPPQR
jgi:hypothetical protein